jgi:hypothetical protein
MKLRDIAVGGKICDASTPAMFSLRLPVILLVIGALGVGFAAGSYFNFAGSRSESAGRSGDGTSATVSGRGTSAYSSLSRVAAEANGAAPDLSSLLNAAPDDYSYHRTKDILDYAESLSPEQIPGVVKQLEKIADPAKREMILSYVTMRWA